MTTYTRIQRIQQTKLYRSGDWFNASKLAQSVSMKTEDLRTVLNQNPDLFERRSDGGTKLMYRKFKPKTQIHFRSKRFDWEGEHSPKFY